MKFGLFGTGPWATEAQGPALAAHPAVELVGVWGRNPAKTGALAQRLDTQPYAEVDDLLADVDAVAVALPPHVQAPIAVRAAQAGRHLLLDKPVALGTADADAILAEVSSRGLASVVFFTSRFQTTVDQFLRETAHADWFGGRAVLHASIFRTGNPFGASPWRQDRGGLWDVGPHALSLLLPALGPVARVAAMAGAHDTTYLLLQHTGGTVSTLSLSLDVPPGATGFETVLYGRAGAVVVPGGDTPAVAAFGRAIDALVGQVTAAAAPHPCDIRFGRDVVAILAAAETARSAGTVVPVPPATEVAGGEPVTGQRAAG